MTHEDEKSFLASINELAPARLVRQDFADRSEMDVASFGPVGNADGDADLCLINARSDPYIKVDSHPAQSRHWVDLLESEVVEFSRSSPFKTWLNDGRLWFDEKSSQGKKSAVFVKWANSLLKWIRNHYEKDASGLYYVAPQALELSKAGKLQLGPSAEPSLSLEERKRILGI